MWPVPLPQANAPHAAGGKANEIMDVNQIAGNPAAQSVFTILLVGAIHALCLSDVYEAIADSKWVSFTRQLFIEAILLYLTWIGIFQPLLTKR